MARRPASREAEWVDVRRRQGVDVATVGRRVDETFEERPDWRSGSSVQPPAEEASESRRVYFTAKNSDVGVAPDSFD
jgi:hypothetical protein